MAGTESAVPTVLPEDLRETATPNRADGYVYLQIPADRLLDVGRALYEEGFLYLRCLSGVDWKDRLQVVYHLLDMGFHGGDPRRIALRVDVDRNDPVLPSVTGIWTTADWHEREAFDLLGIRFTGHPNLRRILLPEHWQGGYPLRKDFLDKRPARPRKVRPR